MRIMRNTRGLEHIADGAFGNVLTNIDGVNNSSPNTAVSLIAMSFKDNVPRPLTVTLFRPDLDISIGGFQVPLGFPSVLVEWGSGGFNNSAIVDGRSGDQFCVSCSWLRVRAFNELMGMAPVVVNGINNPISFGAFASLGRSVNRQGFLKRTQANSDLLAPAGVRIFLPPPFATRFRFLRNPFTAPFSLDIGDGGSSFFSTAVAASANCPDIELPNSGCGVTMTNGAVGMAKQIIVWDLAL